MIYMSKNKYETKMQKIKRDNISKERKSQLRKEKMKYYPKIKLPSTSKLVLLVAFLLCLEITFFCQYVIIATGDTSALYVLIGIPSTLIPLILGYYSKSKAENSKDGIIYDLAMKEAENKVQENSDEAVG